jgi:hypothetical protein
MKARTKIILVTVLLLFALTLGSVALADDGQMFRRNVSGTPHTETEEAGLPALPSSMPFYVPAQASDGTLLEGIDYYDAEGNFVETRAYARPLVSIYIDGIEEEDSGGFIKSAINSYVDGNIEGIESGIGFGARDAFAAVSLDDGATWKRTNLSRSAHLTSFTLQNGTEFPGDVYRMEFAVVEEKIFAVWMSRFCTSGSPAYAEVDEEGDPLYPDLFGVAGSQGSVDYTQQGFPEVGEIPYGCVWTARGTLEYDDETGGFDVIWRKAERLTSGRRDANVQAVAGAKGAGFIIVWQEDPEGLRPGQGLGPGEGWSGAIVNQKTDMWYSYISWDDFGEVIIDETDPDAMPKVAVPMLVPIRLTDNNMCKYNPTYDDDGNVINPYCYEDFDGNGTPDLCAADVEWTNPGNTTLHLCGTEDGRVLWGRTGASRTRLGLVPYTKPDGTTSAWVVMAYEETKALGEGGDTDLDPVDIGKDVMYHTFDMFEYDIVAQGAQLNQPAIDRETGAFFELLYDDWGNPFYETEIARRFSIIIQKPENAGDSGTTLIAIFKQGIINQGGPADIMIRRFVLPEGFDPLVDNPYDIENMVCSNWAYTDGSNPLYTDGLCLDAAMNVSSPTIVSCDIYGDPQTCADNFPWDGGDQYAKVTEWYQYEDNLDDQSWENPYDVAKGHRGFIDGDFIMMMYAWSANWKANSIGNDKYNLYIRRSFDGGVTWTTTPASLGGDGTCHTENYLTGSVESCYAAGAYEQARNVSQLIGTKITVLDPRYTPTPPTIEMPAGYTGPFFFPNYWDDVRDPSKFFVVYETGDNTTVAEGEAVPLDLFYSRAYEYGDEYDYVEWYNNNTGEIELRWDWLENKKDDLSGEAAVLTNPGATFFYAVWNQWQEPEPDVIENSDMFFRRVMYLDTVDGMPSASILHVTGIAVGYNTDAEVEFAGAARDNDHVGAGIIEYLWSSDIDGFLSDSKHVLLPTTDLSPGMHNITFAAQDDEGNWATTSIELLVAEFLHELFLPIMVR